MRKQIAKAVTITSAAVMLAGSFVGTGAAQEAKILEDDTSISGKVSFWIPFNGEQGMNDLIADFNEVYPNIEVELNSYVNGTDGNMAVNTSLMAGEIDVLWSVELSNAYGRWENGLYMDITDMLEADGIDLTENWGSDAFKYQDRVYTVPAGGRSYYVAINMNEWNAAGLGELPAAWTWEEYLDACRAMTHGEGQDKVYGGSPNSSINAIMNTMYQVYGKNAFYHEDGTSSFDDPVIQKALNREVSACNEEGIWFPLATYRADSIRSENTYLTGQTASSLQTALLRFLRDTEQYPVDFVTGFAPYPTEEPGQDNYMEGVATFSHVGIAANVDEENIPASYAFMKFAATYGAKYLAIAGHMPTWTGTDRDEMLDLIFGSKEEAEKLVDTESLTRVVLNFEGKAYVDTELTAYSRINALMEEYVMNAHNGLMTPDEALAELKPLADAEIAES